MKGLHFIREITRKIIDIQTNGCIHKKLKEKQKILNRRYDDLIKSYGYITERSNDTAFRYDNNYPLLVLLK